LNHGSRTLSNHTVSRAVARSRAVRASVARRRRRRIALAAGLGAMLCAPVAWWMAEPAAAVAATAVSHVEDLAELLNQRSPGTRTQDQLTKHARVAAKVRKAAKPVAPVADLPITPSVTELVDLLQPQPVPVAIASANAQPVLVTPPTLSSIFASNPGSSIPGVGGGGGGGGGGNVSFPSSEPREVVPPVSAVPEPGTWAMMLMGFGLVAWRVRRKPRPAREKALKRSLS